MAGDFIPFGPALRSRLSAPDGAAPSKFAPVVSAPAAASSSASDSEHTHGKISIDIKRDGDRISRITVQCRCGEIIDLDCEY